MVRRLATHIDEDGTIHNLGAVHKGGFKYTIVKFTPPKPGRSGVKVTEVKGQVSIKGVTS